MKFYRHIAAFLCAVIIISAVGVEASAQESWVEDTAYWTSISAAEAIALNDAPTAAHWNGETDETYVILYYDSTETESRDLIKQIYDYTQNIQLHIYAVDAALPDGKLPKDVAFMDMRRGTPAYFAHNGTDGSGGSGSGLHSLEQFINNIAIFGIIAVKEAEKGAVNADKITMPEPKYYFTDVYEEDWGNGQYLRFEVVDDTLYCEGMITTQEPEDGQPEISLGTTGNMTTIPFHPGQPFSLEVKINQGMLEQLVHDGMYSSLTFHIGLEVGDLIVMGIGARTDLGLAIQNGKCVLRVCPFSFIKMLLHEEFMRSRTSPYYQEVYQNNLKMEQNWLNPGGALLDAKITPKTQELSDEICTDATTDEEKVHKIREWIAANIVYDSDYYYNISSQVWTQSEDVISHGRTVCDGYANLTRDLICAQNIPCIYVRGDALGAKSYGPWSSVTSGEAHAWNEVLLDGRWVVMDNTWDSGGNYYHGVLHSADDLNNDYFDLEIEYFSVDHKTTKRGGTLASSAPSEWAMNDIRAAITANIVPNEVQHSYQSDITRRDFCALLMSGVAYAGKDNTQTAITATPFPDCEDETVLAAAALGLVNGRSDGTFAPDASITRQEAAVMLANCAELLGLHSDNQGASFKDSASFPSWSKGSIETVAALNVMNGVDGNFVPLGNYTREQAVVTVWRMLTALE